MRDVIIVGAGIIGATVAKAFSQLDTLVIDDMREGAGTPPSGGHLKPSWFGDIPKKEYEPSMKLLDEVWGLKSEKFSIKAPAVGVAVKRDTVYRVDTDEVVRFRESGAVTRGTVIAIEVGGSEKPSVVWRDAGGTKRRDICRLLLVATGVWAGELLKVNVVSKKGVSFRVKGVLGEGIIVPWAPYKQVVAHQQSPGELWIGDGTAVLPNNWDHRRTVICMERCLKVLGKQKADVLSYRSGHRPYCSPVSAGDPCLLVQIGRCAWLATGAGKGGTISAGWVARRMINAYQTGRVGR